MFLKEIQEKSVRLLLSGVEVVLSRLSLGGLLMRRWYLSRRRYEGFILLP
jgi:hypothetical protein